jgi:hypothetical protein
MTKKQKIIFAVLAVLLLAGVSYLAWSNYPKQQAGTACTQEAKICPDGSSVGRTGLNCEFAACPAVSNPGWKTSVDAKSGISFQYPESLPTEYIHGVDWPPQIAVSNSSFSCAEGGSEIMQAGITSKETINGRVYCVTKESEGAAGSVYTKYAYATSIDLSNPPAEGSATATLAFTLRSVQCANYDDPKKTACENERASFSADSLADQIMKSFKKAE